MTKFAQKIIDKSRFKTPRKELKARIAADKEQERKDTLIMPDQEALKRARRKKAAQRRGGRTSTILTTSGDRLGP